MKKFTTDFLIPLVVLVISLAVIADLMWTNDTAYKSFSPSTLLFLSFVSLPAVLCYYISQNAKPYLVMVLNFCILITLYYLYAIPKTGFLHDAEDDLALLTLIISVLAVVVGAIIRIVKGRYYIARDALYKE